MDVKTAEQARVLLGQLREGIMPGTGALEKWAESASAVLRAAGGPESWVEGRDAAFPANLHGWDGLVIGYYGGPVAFHVWSASDWSAFGGYKLPVWVGGYAGTTEGEQAVSALKRLGVPPGCETMLDMETRVDRTYVGNFWDVLVDAGYRVLVYGSVSTLFKNPACNGYAVADPTGVPHMYPHAAVRLTQWAFGETFDSDVIKQWIARDGFLWR
jgi:hypothetical protein